MDLTRHLSPIALTVVSAFCLAGCALSPNHTSYLENDELYLESNEEFISDGEYLASAYASSDESINNVDYWSGSNISYGMGSGCSSFGCYGSYGNYGNMNNGWGNAWGNGWNNGFGGSNFYGYDPFNSGYYGYGGYNPYGYSPFGYYGGNNGFCYNGWGNSWNNGWGNWGSSGDVYTTSTVIIKPRTPLSTNVLTNSNYRGRRLETNKSNQVEISKSQARTQTQQRINSSSRNSIWGNSSRRNNSNLNNSGNNSRNNSSWGSSGLQPSNNNRSNVGSSRPSSRPSSTRSSIGSSSSSRPSGGRR